MTNKLMSTVFLILAVLLLAAAGDRGQASAAPATLDSTFGNGIVTTAVTAYPNYGHAVAVQSDGKIVAAGVSQTATQSVFSLARYNTDGSLDTTFNATGKVTTAIGAYDDQIFSLAIQADGKIVAAGYSHNGTQKLFALARYTTNGSLDTTFNPAGSLPGTVTTAFGTVDDEARSVAIRPDGKIAAAGFSKSGAQFLFAVACYNADGSPDNGFNTTGKVTTVVGAGGGGITISDSAYSVVVQSDGRIVVGGQSNTSIGYQYMFALVRYNTNGSLDTGFNGTGKVLTPIGAGPISSKATAYSLAIAADGKIVAAGSAIMGTPNVTYSLALARYNTNGSLDTSFNGTGVVVSTLASNSYANSVTVQADGRIVAAGMTGGGTKPWAYLLERYNSNGSLDASFNGTGMITNGGVTTEISTNADGAYAVALQPDGKIVALGTGIIGSKYLFSLTRYNNNGSPDHAFSTFPGVVTTAWGDSFGSVGAAAVAIQPADGKIVAAGGSYKNAKYIFALARYNPDGGLDPGFNGSGVVTTVVGTNASPTAVALQADGKIVTAGYTWIGNGTQYLFALTRHNPDGSLDTGFNGTGIVTTAVGASFDEAYSVAIQPADGKIVVGGTSKVGTQFVSALTRYNVDGTLDTTFNGTGIVTTAIGASDDTVSSLFIDPGSGKITAAGYSYSGARAAFAITRYNTDGTLDTTFNAIGRVTTQLGTGTAAATSVSVSPADGTIVAAGHADVSLNAVPHNAFALVRYKSDGSLDTSFNGTGSVLTDVAGSDDEAFAVALQADGKIVAAGYSHDGVGIQDFFALARYNTNGSLDTTFNGNGKLTTLIGPNSGGSKAKAYAMDLQPNGKIVAAGQSHNGYQNVVAVARYRGDTVNLARIAETAIPYADIQAAYTAAQDGQSIEAQEGLCGLALLLDRPVSVALRGGYDANYALRPGNSLVYGRIEISGNSVTLDEIIVE